MAIMAFVSREMAGALKYKMQSSGIYWIKMALTVGRLPVSLNGDGYNPPDIEL